MNKKTSVNLTVLSFLLLNLPAQANSLEIQEFVADSLKNNLEFQALGANRDLAKSEQVAANGAFAPVFTMSALHTTTKDQVSNSFMPTVLQVDQISLGISKPTEFGGKLGLTLSSTQNKSDSPFATNPILMDGKLELTYSQAILNNGFGVNNSRSLESARTGLNLANAEYATNRDQLILNAARSYWRFAHAVENRKIRKGFVDRAKALLATNTRLKKRGLLETGDLYATRALVAVRESALLDARQSETAAWNDARVVAGYGDSKPLAQPSALTFRPISLSESPAPLGERSDIKQLALASQLASTEEATRKDMAMPDLDLQLSLGYLGREPNFGDALETLSKFKFSDFTAMITFNIALGENVHEAAWHRARIQRRQANQRLQYAKHAASLSLDSARNQLTSLEEQAKLAKKVITLQEKKLRFEERRYRQGRSTSRAIIDYQNDLLNARLSLAGVILRYETAKLDYWLARGMINETFKPLTGSTAQ
jgi:outer membrane protein TolC